VYQMLPVSLDCPFFIAPQLCLSSSSVLCTKCCHFIVPQFCLSSSCVLFTQCCHLLWIVHSSLPLSFVCLRPVSCVPNVASFSGLSILDCPSVVFVFVLRLVYQMLSLHCPSVLFVFVLCPVYQMLLVSLDCPFLIAPQLCLSSSSVLCTKCCQFLWIVHS
jgi:hypothetical protein